MDFDLASAARSRAVKLVEGMSEESLAGLVAEAEGGAGEPGAGPHARYVAIMVVRG